jgi:hypothetical protein
MRQYGLFFIFLGVLNWALAQETVEECEGVNVDQVKELLGEAHFDNFRSTKIKYAKDPYDIEFQVDLLQNFTYKLVFDMSSKSEGVVVKLFDIGAKKKNKSQQKPKLLYISTDEQMDENTILTVEFEAPRTRMLVRYEVKDATYEGCVSFILGTKFRNSP